MLNIKKRLTELNKIYNKIPKMECVPGCSDCCGPVNFQQIEKVNLNRFLKTNGINKKKLLSLDKVISMIKSDSSDEKFMCPYRKDNRCEIYPVRPIVCRLFGVVKHDTGLANLQCLHSDAKTYLTEEQSYKLMEEVKRL